MAYTSPSTKAASDTISAADWNTYLRDNLGFLYQPPSCRVYNSANISVANATAQALTFNSERYDTDTMHSTASNTSRITFTTAGKYEVGGCVRWAAQATYAGVREIGIRLNGATYIVVNDEMGSASANALTIIQAVTTEYVFAAADYVELVAYQSSGGALNAENAGNYSPEMWASWLSG